MTSSLASSLHDNQLFSIKVSTRVILLISSPCISVVRLSTTAGFLLARKTFSVREDQLLNIMKELPHDTGSLLSKRLEILEGAHILFVIEPGVLMLKEASIVTRVLSTSLRYCVS